jgi:type I restriction enzyme M protein
LILNRNKPENRKNKIVLVYAARDYEEGKVRNKLRETDIEKIVSAFRGYKEIDSYCHIADFEELKENEFNLNVPRYVDTSDVQDEIDIQATIDGLKQLDKEKKNLEQHIHTSLHELGFNI